MGLLETQCPSCKLPHLWFTRSNDQRCEACMRYYPTGEVMDTTPRELDELYAVLNWRDNENDFKPSGVIALSKRIISERDGWRNNFIEAREDIAMWKNNFDTLAARAEKLREAAQAYRNHQFCECGVVPCHECSQDCMIRVSLTQALAAYEQEPTPPTNPAQTKE